jgi:hypothetical protein
MAINRLSLLITVINHLFPKKVKKPMKARLALLLIVILFAVAFLSYNALNNQEMCLTKSEISKDTSFSLNLTSVAFYYLALQTPSGLEKEYPNSHVIYLADDQALDYFALIKLYNLTRFGLALSITQKILNASKAYGGLFKYWNPVFEVLGVYPTTTIPMSGVDHRIGSLDGYTLMATIFRPNPSFDYYSYADQLAYRTLLEVHLGNYSQAEVLFENLSKMWNGKGFVDKAFNGVYQSYKLADYVIVWRVLASNAHTCQFAKKYLTIVHRITSIMSVLQSYSGGVWTGYKWVNQTMVYGTNISLTNGETTSLFVISF